MIPILCGNALLYNWDSYVGKHDKPIKIVCSLIKDAPHRDVAASLMSEARMARPRSMSSDEPHSEFIISFRFLYAE
jgi:hypothetical protein